MSVNWHKNIWEAENFVSLYKYLDSFKPTFIRLIGDRLLSDPEWGIPLIRKFPPKLISLKIEIGNAHSKCVSELIDYLINAEVLQITLENIGDNDFLIAEIVRLIITSKHMKEFRLPSIYHICSDNLHCIASALMQSSSATTVEIVPNEGDHFRLREAFRDFCNPDFANKTQIHTLLIHDHPINESCIKYCEPFFHQLLRNNITIQHVGYNLNGSLIQSLCKYNTNICFQAGVNVTAAENTIVKLYKQGSPDKLTSHKHLLNLIADKVYQTYKDPAWISMAKIKYDPPPGIENNNNNFPYMLCLGSTIVGAIALAAFIIMK